MGKAGVALIAAILLSATLTLPTRAATSAPSAASASTIGVGSHPFGVAAAGGRVYVANNGGSTVTVLNAATETLIGTIAVASGPAMIAVDDARGRAWVTSFNTASTQVVDLSSGAVIATIAAGGLGVGVDRAAGRVYAASSSALTVIDADTNAVVATIPKPQGGWWGVAVNGTTHRVYVTDIAHDALDVIDGSSNSVVATVPLSPTPSRFGVAVDEATGYVYVASYPAAIQFNSGPLRVIDGATNTVVASLPMQTASLGVAVDPARHRAYATMSFGSAVAIVDTSTSSYMGLHDTGLSPAGVAVDAATGKVFVANNADNSVSVIAAINQVPIIDSLTITPASPTTNDTLTAHVVARDSSGQATSSARYEWRRNGDVVGGSGPTLDLSTSGYGDKGDVITVTAIVRDQVSESAPASASVTIADSPPTVSVSLSSTTPRSRDTLVATAVPGDADGDAVVLTYVWKVNGTVRQTVTTTSTTSSFDLSRGTAINRDVVTVAVTPTAGGATGASATATAVVTQGQSR